VLTSTLFTRLLSYLSSKVVVLTNKEIENLATARQNTTLKALLTSSLGSWRWVPTHLSIQLPHLERALG
jgi:hypothetical protein